MKQNELLSLPRGLSYEMYWKCEKEVKNWIMKWMVNKIVKRRPYLFQKVN